MFSNTNETRDERVHLENEMRNSLVLLAFMFILFFVEQLIALTTTSWSLVSFGLLVTQNTVVSSTYLMVGRVEVKSLIIQRKEGIP